MALLSNLSLSFPNYLFSSATEFNFTVKCMKYKMGYMELPKQNEFPPKARVRVMSRDKLPRFLSMLSLKN